MAISAMTILGYQLSLELHSQNFISSGCCVTLCAGPTNLGGLRLGLGPAHL